MSLTKPTRRSGWPIKAFYILIPILICLVSGELALRAFHHFRPSFVFYSDSYDRYRAKPHSMDWGFKLNSLGFKDVEFEAKQENVYRILGLGDSFAFGIPPYEYNYLTLLDDKLDTPNKSVEVLNMGIPGIQPIHYLNLLGREGIRLDPDMVLLSLFIGNDFDKEIDTPPEIRSYLATFVHYLVTIFKGGGGKMIYHKGDYCDDCPNFDIETYLQIEKSRLKICLTPNSVFQARLEVTLDYLKEIQELCQRIDAEFIVVLIPDEGQVNHSLQQQVIEAYREEGENRPFNPELPNGALAARLKQENIELIDLYPFFENSQNDYYRVRDSHWNIPGNRLAADRIHSSIYDRIHDESAGVEN